MYPNSRSYAITALIVITALVFVGAPLWTYSTAATTHRHAVELGNLWVSEIFTPEEAATARLSCQASDSDSNGYVSCTLNITRNGESQLVPIECNSYVFMNVGDTCRPLVPLTLGVRR